MGSNDNPYVVSPATQKHHIVEEDTGYPFKEEVRKKVRIGFEPWALNMVGTLIVWMARSFCVILYYAMCAITESGHATMLEQVQATWALGEGYFSLKFTITVIFLMPAIFFVFLFPGALMRTKLFTLPDNHAPRRKWWHWLAGM
jgi:hypothetical protein